MDKETVSVFLNLIGQMIRMAPIFICLKPKHGSYENIAAASVYIWVIMISAQSLFHMPDSRFLIFRGVFNAIFFFILLIFFEGSFLIKFFLYISAWLFAELLGSINAFLGWVFRRQSRLSYEEICLIMAVSMLAAYAVFIQLWLKNKILRLFDILSFRDSSLLLAVPCFFLVLLFFGTRTLFHPVKLLNGSVPVLIFYLVFCIMTLIVYILVIADSIRMIDQQETHFMLQAARQVIELKKENYNQIQEHQQEIRIIRHDFRHHIHALLHMDDSDRREYLMNLQDELSRGQELYYCPNPAVNGLLQEYANLSKSSDISFEALVSFGDTLPVDSLTLCVILGNLLQNALEANLLCPKDRFISVHMKSEGGSLRIMVENRCFGEPKKQGGRLLTTKPDGGLGMLSIRRLLDQPGDDFDYYEKNGVFSAMIYLAERTPSD